MARIMSRYGWTPVPATGANVDLFVVPAAKKLELISWFLQSNGAAGFNVTVSDVDPVTGVSFVAHVPALPAGPAVASFDLRSYVIRAGGKLRLNCFAGPTAINMAVTGILVDV